MERASFCRGFLNWVQEEDKMDIFEIFLSIYQVIWVL